MTAPDTFVPELFLEQSPIMDEIHVLTSPYCFIEEVDLHNPNIFHGRTFECLCRRDESCRCSFSISLIMFRNCKDASDMRLRLMSSAIFPPSFPLHVKCKQDFNPHLKLKSTLGRESRILTKKTDLDKENSFRLWAEEKGLSSRRRSAVTVKWKAPVIVTSRMPPTTFDDWMKNANFEDSLQFFQYLFSDLKIIHQGKKYFGNLRYGIRICKNKPILFFPAKFKDMELDQGLRNDLQELKKMIFDSNLVKKGQNRLACELDLFNKLCIRYVDDVKSYTGAKLRDGSILILSSPIVWTPTKRCDFIRKMGEYREFDCGLYDALVSDDPPLGLAIPNVDWWVRLKNPVAGTPEEMLSNVFKKGSKKNKKAYTSSSERIRYFHHCTYEHVPISSKGTRCRDYPEVSDLLYSVYPDAPSLLYDFVLINRLYEQDKWLPLLG